MKRMRLVPLAILVILISTLSATAHEASPRVVVIDTDMALDDVRALTLLACSDAVEILACVCSDGACAPPAGAWNARFVLDALGHSHVPVIAGRALDRPAPAWRSMSESLAWTRSVDPSSIPPRPDGSSPATPVGRVAARVAGHSEVVYLCLGPLTNLADLIVEQPRAAERFSAIYYRGSPPGITPLSWNTARDPEAAQSVFDAGLPIHTHHVPDSLLLVYDTELAEAVCGMEEAAAELLCRLHRDERVRSLISAGHFVCWDESLVLDFLFPGLFAWRPSSAGRLQLASDTDRARRSYLGLLAGDLSLRPGHRHGVTLRDLSFAKEWLRPDVAEIQGVALSLHGSEEWNAVLLTNELHRHLGIYSILGAKMGIRARELLGAGVDELEVSSMAGFDPPLSCLTDGLQVSTGATLGRGAIAVIPGVSRPAAQFRKDDRLLQLEIRDDLVARIREDVANCVDAHGALTPAYWAAIRSLALAYWRDVDRKRVFEELWLEP